MWGRCIGRGRPEGPEQTVEIYILGKTPKEEVTVLEGMGPPREPETQQEELIQGWELPRALNLAEESSELLRWTHLEQMQHYPDIAIQVTFPVRTEQVEIGPGLE